MGWGGGFLEVRRPDLGAECQEHRPQAVRAREARGELSLEGLVRNSLFLPPIHSVPAFGHQTFVELLGGPKDIYKIQPLYLTTTKSQQAELI